MVNCSLEKCHNIHQTWFYINCVFFGCCCFCLLWVFVALQINPKSYLWAYLNIFSTYIFFYCVFIIFKLCKKWKSGSRWFLVDRFSKNKKETMVDDNKYCDNFIIILYFSFVLFSFMFCLMNWFFCHLIE